MVRDPYRWLEDGASPAVQAWVVDQDGFARAHLDAIPFRAELRRRLETLFAIGSVSAPSVHRGRCFFLRRSGQEEQPRLYLREPGGDQRLLLDPARLGADTTSALDWYYPSPDGRRLAYGVSEGGSEDSRLHVMDVATGEPLGAAVPRTRACSLAWLPDASGFYYTRYPAPGSVPPGEESYHRRVFFHVLGSDWRDDRLVFPLEARPGEDWPSLALSPDGRWLVVSVSRGWTRTDVYLVDRATGERQVTVVEGEEAVFGAVPRPDRLYLLTNLDAPRYRLVSLDPTHPARGSWRTVVAESEAVLETFAVVGERLVCAWLRDASSALSLHALDGQRLGEVPLAGIGSVSSLSGEWDGSEVYFGFSSFVLPPRVERIDLATAAVTTWAAIEAPLAANAFDLRFERCASRDGTPLTLFLVARRGRPRDGHGAAVVTGYGGFNVSLTPAFGRSLIAWLEAGGLWVVAHLRGGGEHGEEWHRAGMRECKQNVFDDFVAVAEYLVATGAVARDRLGILGGSNGGLLVGAALTQRPELYRAAVCQVPLMDMLRYHRFRIARLWIPEYGDPDEPEAFAWLHAYSPYHRVRDGTRYPAVLLTSGEEDSRVDPLHARKMTARLQAANGSGRPVLLRLETRAGHGQGKPTSKALEEWADIWAFLMAELGVRPG